mmetsp:Transcript_65957/g.208784  ORF Transcript_65957/g.208784 Transcript_65957/m.208784 type:complete len:263 (+) Transcript_65957:358-1146(+)
MSSPGPPGPSSSSGSQWRPGPSREMCTSLGGGRPASSPSSTAMPSRPCPARWRRRRGKSHPLPRARRLQQPSRPGPLWSRCSAPCPASAPRARALPRAPSACGSPRAASPRRARARPRGRPSRISTRAGAWWPAPAGGSGSASARTPPSWQPWPAWRRPWMRGGSGCGPRPPSSRTCDSRTPQWLRSSATTPSGSAWAWRQWWARSWRSPGRPPMTKSPRACWPSGPSTASSATRSSRGSTRARRAWRGCTRRGTSRRWAAS